MVVSLILLYHIILLISNIAAHGILFCPTIAGPDPVEVSFNLVVKNILYTIQILIFLSMQVFALFLLLSIRKDETPFKLKNVKLLKSMAIMLMVLEPLQVITKKSPLL